MKKYRRATAAGLSAVFISGVLSLPAFAAVANPFTWDGRSSLAENHTYYISDSITVSGSYTLPESSSISILSGGSVKILSGSSLNVKGTLKISDGGSALVSGQLAVADGSDFSVYGSYSGEKGSELSLKGDMYCEKGSSVALGGEVSVSETGSFSSHGSVLLSGNLKSRSDVNIYGGEMTVSGKAELGGSTEINGVFSIEDSAEITNSGGLLFSEDCRYISEGIFSNTGNGYVTDNRRVYDESSMSSSHLALYTCDPIKGIDVSVWQGEIDWAQVKQSGIEFAIIRSSRGYISESSPMANDEMFHRNMLEASKNGMNIGVYHYCYAETVEQARNEARIVLSLIENYDVNYPVIIDIEDIWYTNNNYTKKELTDITAAFCEEIKSAGYLPMIYSYASFFDTYLDMDSLAEYPVWVAHVNTDSPDYDGRYFMWQYSWEGQVDGIEGSVDMNYSYVDFAEYTNKFGLNNLMR